MVAITTLLLTLLVPALSVAKARAMQIACASNMRQINVAVRQYDMDEHMLPEQASGFLHDEQWPGRLRVTGYVNVELGEAGAYYKGTVYDCPANTEKRYWSWPPEDPPLANDLWAGEYAMNAWTRHDERRMEDGSYGPNQNLFGRLTNLDNPSEVWLVTDCDWTNPDWMKHIASPDYSVAAVIVHDRGNGNNFLFADGAVAYRPVLRGYNPFGPCGEDGNAFDVRWGTIANDSIWP